MMARCGARMLVWVLALLCAPAFAQWTTNANGDALLGTTTVLGNDYAAPNLVIDGAQQFKCNYNGPPWAANIAGIGCRVTGETIADPSLVIRAPSYQLETLVYNNAGVATGIHCSFIMDRVGFVWIGADCGAQNWTIHNRLEVDGGAVFGNGFQSKNSPSAGPANGIAVQGDVGVGTKSITPYGGGSRNLAVQSGANANLQLIQGSGNGVAVMQMNASVLEISTQTNHAITLAPNGSTRVVVNPDGSLRLPAYVNCTLKTDASGNLICG